VTVSRKTHATDTTLASLGPGATDDANVAVRTQTSRPFRERSLRAFTVEGASNNSSSRPGERIILDEENPQLPLRDGVRQHGYRRPGSDQRIL